MDLLSRLIAGSAATSPTKQKLNTPAERLTACKRICATLQHTWRNGTRLSNDDSASNHVTNLLNRMNTILHDESRKAAPHSCLIHVASAQVYIIVAKLALLSDNPGVINGAREFFHVLINGEAEGILDSKIFARSLIDLVRRNTQPKTIVVDEQGEADLVELLFEIATKIRLDLDILPAWFYPERDQSRSWQQGAEAKRSQFPLFYVLVEYVHHDAPTGDFARTGLLYLTDLASRSKQLEKWMIESDLAPQMASGLCALYSRLSRQAYVLTIDEKMLPIIALSDTLSADAHVDEAAEELQTSVKAFLTYLAFWQDTLNHCKSEEVRDNLLDHFQVLFVQQLLYPSLLESSDVAGGSTSAVILHSYRMFEALEHPEIAKRMLRYLLAADKQKPELSAGHKRGRISISRRKSMEHLATLAEIANSPSPDLFNLLDLLTLSLRSTHPQTVNASLKLVTVILRRHHHHVLSNIFRLQPLTDTEATQTVTQLNNTMFKMFDLVGSVAHVDTADESYQAALSDGHILLQRHSCMLFRSNIPANIDVSVYRQGISADCKLFEAIIDLTRSFFTNDAITNITLTETILALASCEYIFLRDWLVDERESDINDQKLSVMAVFQELVEQLEQWKARFNEWHLLFSFQRARLASGDYDLHNNNNPRSLSPASHHSNNGRANSPQPQQRPALPIRTSTTRGSKAPPAGFASIDGTLARSPKLTPTSPNVKAFAGSPLQQTTLPGDITGNASAASASTCPSLSSLAQLQQQVTLPAKNVDEAVSTPAPPFLDRLRVEDAGSGSGSDTPAASDRGSGSATPTGEAERTSATLSHIMTNAVILQEFVLEIAAMLQIRATLFDEVDLTSS